MARTFRKIAAVVPTAAPAPAAAPEAAPAEEVSYRDLQAQAKAAGLTASGTREELEKRIAKAKL